MREARTLTREFSELVRAAIDVGTNSVLLLVAEIHPDPTSTAPLRVLYEAESVTRLGEAVHGSELLQPEAISRTIQAVGAFAREARLRGAADLRIVATSAVREAKNAQDFLAAVEREIGERVEVLSGADEARAAFRGVLAGVAREVEGELLVIDVGGGSTELVVGGDRPHQWVSLDIGTVRLSELALKHDPYLPHEWHEVRGLIRRHLQRVSFDNRHPSKVVGVGGTITTLGMLQLGLTEYSAKALHGARLSVRQIDGWAERLAGLTVAQRRRLRGVPPLRADVLPVGAAIFAEVLQHFGRDELEISTYGIRHGILLG